MFHSSHLFGRSPANAHTWAEKTDHGEKYLIQIVF
jgi:hypothetical protein